MSSSARAVAFAIVQVTQTDSPGNEWDEFVESTPGAQLGHAAAWAGILRDAYGLEPLYLTARRSTGEIDGVLPLVSFRTLGGKRELISIPFHDASGVLARSSEASEALVSAAFAAVDDGGYAALELRQNDALDGIPASDTSEPRVGLVLPLENSEAAQWKSVGSKVRNQTRKAGREGLSLAGGARDALLEGFYRPFAVNMRDLGSPVHSRRFFETMATGFGDRLRFIVVEASDRSVGGLVAIHYASKVTVTWASTLRSERARCPNNVIYWEALRWSIALGVDRFDFGRSPVGAGTYHFKRGWGAQAHPLAWTRFGRSRERLPIASARQSALLARLSAVWGRLPIAATRHLGPRIRRFLAS